MNRCATIFIMCAALPACHARDTQKRADPKEVSACLAGQSGHDDYFLVTKCEPLGPQERFQGTWFAGFELSEFRPGYFGVPADFGKGRDASYLIVPTAWSRRAFAADPAECPCAYQITFLGRESSEPYMPGVKLVVADKILSFHRVPISPSVANPRS